MRRKELNRSKHLGKYILVNHIINNIYNGYILNQSCKKFYKNAIKCEFHKIRIDIKHLPFIYLPFYLLIIVLFIILMRVNNLEFPEGQSYFIHFLQISLPEGI